MEYLIIIALACSPAVNKVACESDLKNCVLEAVKEPEMQEFTAFDIAVGITQDAKLRRKLCK